MGDALKNDFLSAESVDVEERESVCTMQESEDRLT